MKMGPALFWGLILVIIGLSMVFKVVFNVDFPLFKIIFAFILIFLGIRILFGNIHSKDKNRDGDSVVFGERKFSTVESHKEYSVVFSKGDFDLRNIVLENETKKVKISTVFGASEIKLSRETPARIRVEAAFSGVSLPNGNTAAFGSATYESPGLDTSQPFLDIKIDVVFGGSEIKLY